MYVFFRIAQNVKNLRFFKTRIFFDRKLYMNFHSTPSRVFLDVCYANRTSFQSTV